ncbi:hypothetical protein LBMAG57_20840 [Verrucomicrobiota bacterium]|nr:hypothetical protein LBMAG57_20840 [Verrucomicrobiota bacterium]
MARHYTLHRPQPSGPRIDFAAELNPQQLEAVTAPPGPALVIAGAGSGKTRTLTYRVAYLMENGIRPEHILLLTFTNKAAREMCERVGALVTGDLMGLWGGTFHSMGARILRRHPNEAGFAPGFSIMDREDSEEMLDGVISTLGFDPKEKRFPKGGVLADALSFQLNTGRKLDDVLLEKYPHFLEFSEHIADVRKKYEARKKKANVLDFDDLLEKTVTLLKNNAAIAEHYQRQFQFILVDEYQDTNHLQNDFIEMLAARHHNVMVVGDDAQSIYSWRGADFRNILEFPKRHPGAKIYKIETNYRSVPEVLELANAVIAANEHQFEKHLVAARPGSGMRPALVPLADSQQQAQFVAQRILELHEEGTKLEEMAVLYRAHFHSMELQMELTRRGVPFEITSGLRFFEQAHIKDVSAFLKWVVNPHDEVAFKRMVRLMPGVGPRSADALWDGVVRALAAAGTSNVQGQGQTSNVQRPTSNVQSSEAAQGASTPNPSFSPGSDEPTEALPETVANPWEGLPSIKSLLMLLKVPAKAQAAWQQCAYTLDELAPGGRLVPPSQMIHSVMEAIYDDYAQAKFPNYDQRREDLNTLANFSRQFESTQTFLDQLALLTTMDSNAASADDPERVTLSSVHQAKGLEWKVVFVIWLADGKFPTGRSLENSAAVEEERRLFYVAVTRAKDELYLSYPCMSFNSGYGDPLQRPSRFLAEIPKKLIEDWEVGGSF